MTFRLVAASILTSLSLASTALAAGTAADLGGPITLSGNTGTQTIFTDGNGNNTFGFANIKLTAELSENIKAVLMFRIRQSLTQQGVPSQTIDNMLSEAYIKIDKVGGNPVAFIIGKQTVAFGNLQTLPPNFELDPIRRANYQRDVIGFTVQLADAPFFDLVEASVFETKAGDLSIGDINGVSIRVTKDVTEKWKVVASAMHKGDGRIDNDNRETVGFIFKDGNWTVWAEGVHMDGNSNFPNSEWAATAGASYKVNADQRIVVYSSYIEDALTRISLSYEIQITKNIYVSPELAYIIKADGSGEWQTVVRSELRFSTK